MSLAALIRKRDKEEVATATLATVRPVSPLSVAKVATVRVANPTEAKTGMTGDEAARVNAWLDDIGAVEPEERSEVIEDIYQGHLRNWA